MKTPEEIKKLIDYCYQSNPCSECSYNKKDFPECVRRVYRDATEIIDHQENRIKQLEERIDLMMIQMRGDCGCCKHKEEKGEPCISCSINGDRPSWEYEGLPELPKKGESA